jgi:hypothetical protein
MTVKEIAGRLSRVIDEPGMHDWQRIMVALSEAHAEGVRSAASEARAKALEEAAKVADKGAIVEFLGHPSASRACARIAAGIRALAGKEEGEKRVEIPLIGRCPKCGIPRHENAGFCGGCKP